MKKYIIPLIAVVFLISCKEKSKTAVLNSEEASNKIHSNFDKVNDCAKALRDGDFMQFVEQISDIDDESVDGDWIDELIEVFGEQVFDDEFYSDNRVNFSQYEGIYSWNMLLQRFDKQNAQNVIEMRIPSSQNDQTNLNMIFKADKFTETAVIIDGETYYFPKTLDMKLVLNNKEISAFRVLDLKVDQASGGNTSLPVNIELEFFSAPYTQSLTLSRENARNYTLNYSLDNNGNCTYQLRINATSNTDTYEEFDIEENLLTVSGEVVFNDVIYSYTVDAKNLSGESDVSVSEMNRYIDIDVIYDGNKIGEIRFDEVDDEITAYVVYLDGTEENFEDLLQMHLEELEAIFSEFSN